jgi:hypothetical protein
MADRSLDDIRIELNDLQRHVETLATGRWLLVHRP